MMGEEQNVSGAQQWPPYYSSLFYLNAVVRSTLQECFSLSHILESFACPLSGITLIISIPDISAFSATQKFFYLFHSLFTALPHCPPQTCQPQIFSPSTYDLVSYFTEQIEAILLSQHLPYHLSFL